MSEQQTISHLNVGDFTNPQKDTLRKILRNLYSDLTINPVVNSVNGETGIVDLDADDVDDSGTTNKFVTQAEKDAIAALGDLANENGPLVIGQGGTGANISTQAGYDSVIIMYAGNSYMEQLEIGGNLGVIGGLLDTVQYPSFTDVTTTTVNGYTAPLSGTYTPTLTNVANVASFGTVSDATYFRVGNFVTVFGRVSIDPTSASVNTEFGVSLPIASDLTLFTDLGGTAACLESVSLCAGIRADTTNNRANVKYVNTTDTANREWAYHFSYRIK